MDLRQAIAEFNKRPDALHLKNLPQKTNAQNSPQPLSPIAAGARPQFIQFTDCI